MRILIFGAAGMLGHKVWQTFRERFDTYATVRKAIEYYSRFNLFDQKRVKGEVDVRRLNNLLEAIAWASPNVVVNCVGVIKQIKAAEDPVTNLEINALFPHRLALACRAAGVRLIHISTDCVFSGQEGHYSEDAPSDAKDIYGRTKFLGEVCGVGVLTLRTSVIGRELETRYGLLEWFLAQGGKKCKGYARAIYSGLTTLAFADLLVEIVQNHPNLSGLYHVSSNPISKFDLLKLLKTSYGIEVEIEKDTDFVCDRSLDSSRFRKATGWVPDSWQTMISRMHADCTPYEIWK
jgi:dTDP-4-dehydrorhamnose reductase